MKVLNLSFSAESHSKVLLQRSSCALVEHLLLYKKEDQTLSNAS